MPAGLAPGLEGAEYALIFAFFGLALFAAIAALLHEHDRPFSAAIVYVVLGLVASAALTFVDLPRLDPLGEGRALERVAEVTVVLAVFAAGMSVHRVHDARSWRTVAMLLVVVLPVTIGLLALYGVHAMGLSLGAAVLLGAALSPTDPVLGGGIGLEGPGEEENAQGEPRFSLHTEAAINDGMAAPFVVLALFIAERDGSSWLAEWVLTDVVYAGGVGTLAGLAGGHGIALAVHGLREREAVSPDLDRFVAAAAALLVYGAVEAIGAYGFVASFTAGFAFRRREYEHELNERVHAGADRLQTLLELTALLLFGSMVTFSGLAEPGLAGWLVVPLLLLVLRPALVWLLVGRGYLSRPHRMFVGFFGVRGMATLYYVAAGIHGGALASAEEIKVFWTCTVVVLVSILVHGISATPLSRRLRI